MLLASMCHMKRSSHCSQRWPSVPSSSPYTKLPHDALDMSSSSHTGSACTFDVREGVFEVRVFGVELALLM